MRVEYNPLLFLSKKGKEATTTTKTKTPAK